MGVGTKLFMESMEETGYFADYGEYTCNKFRTGHKIKIGNLTIEPIAVDHSIPAAYGFIIHTSERVVVYTWTLGGMVQEKALQKTLLKKPKKLSQQR